MEASELVYYTAPDGQEYVSVSSMWDFLMVQAQICDEEIPDSTGDATVMWTAMSEILRYKAAELAGCDFSLDDPNGPFHNSLEAENLGRILLRTKAEAAQASSEGRQEEAGEIMADGLTYAANQLEAISDRLRVGARS